MFYDEQGRAGRLRSGEDAVAYFLQAGGVEVGGGFVEDHGAGVHREDARQAEALFLTAGQCATGVVEGQVVEPYGGEGFGDAAPRFLRGGTRRFSGPKATSLPTVAMTMEDSGSCCIMPAVPRASAGACPLMVMVPPADSPSSSWSTPAMACRSVDLPAPEVPSSRTFSPGLMVRLSPLMTGSGRPGWCQLKLLSSMRAPRGVAHDGSLAFVWLL